MTKISLQPANLRKTFRGVILDMDGVLWRADEPIGDLPGIFRQLEKKGLQTVLVTNNSTGTRQIYRDKLKNYGVHIRLSQIVTSAEGAARFLRERFNQLDPAIRVFVVGEKGLDKTLQEYGFQITVEKAQAVVVGLDRQVTYAKIRQASDLIRAGAIFVATNADATLPTPKGPIPGAGAILAAVRTASEVEPVVIGKPGVKLYEMALEQLRNSTTGRVEPDQILAVGDRLDTDIAGAQKLKLRTALVLSGVTSRTQAEAWQPPPDWIAQDLTHLLEMI